jgi:Flp pilus assembly protein TadD
MNVPSCAALLLLAVTALSPCAESQQSKPTVRHHRIEEIVADESSSPEVDQTETAMQHSEFATAESLLLRAVAARPNDYRAWFDLGYIYNSTHRSVEALDAYRKSVAAKPDVFESDLNLGILLARQGDNAAAATYLKATTLLKPTAHPEEALARAWQSLGHVEEASDPQQALAAYVEAARLNLEDPEPHLSAAILLEKQGNLNAAEREFRAAYELNSKSQDALAGLANSYTQQKKYPEAEAMLRTLVQAHPQDNNARIQLGRVLAQQGRNEEAAAELQRGWQARADDPQVALELGTLYLKAGKNSEAEDSFASLCKKCLTTPWRIMHWAPC